MTENVQLEAKGLTFAHASYPIFENIDFTVKQGQCMYVTGKNGAGKTTLLKLLCGFLPNHSGEIFFNKEKLVKANHSEFQRQVLFLGHKLSIYPELSILENIRYYLSLVNEQYNEAATLDILEKLQLRYFADVSCKQLSAGQQRKVALSRLWLIKRAVWILDEPFYALDKDSITLINNKIIEQLDVGMVIASAHHGMAVDDKKIVHLEL